MVKKKVFKFAIQAKFCWKLCTTVIVHHDPWDVSMSNKIGAYVPSAQVRQHQGINSKQETTATANTWQEKKEVAKLTNTVLHRAWYFDPILRFHTATAWFVWFTWAWRTPSQKWTITRKKIVGISSTQTKRISAVNWPTRCNRKTVTL